METAKLVRAYVRLRDARAELKSEYKEKDSDLEGKMDRIEAALLKHANENSLDSMKTEYGTASKVMRTRYWAPDWAAFTDFVEEHKDLISMGDLLEHRIHQGNYKEFLGNNPDLVPPVSADSRFSIVVRRGNNT